MFEQNYGSQPTRKEQTSLYLILLLLLFVSTASVLAVYTHPQILQNPLILILVGAAAFRGGRAIAYNFIFSWLRAPFTKVVDDSSGAGKSVEARGHGIQRVIGEMLCCPTCAGTWVALSLAGLLVLVYPIGLTLAFVLAASGIGEILHWRAERDEWQGRAAREAAGTAWLWKNKAGEKQLSRQEGLEQYSMEARNEEKTSSLV